MALVGHNGRHCLAVLGALVEAEAAWCWSSHAAWHEHGLRPGSSAYSPEPESTARARSLAQMHVNQKMSRTLNTLNVVEFTQTFALNRNCDFQQREVAMCEVGQEVRFATVTTTKRPATAAQRLFRTGALALYDLRPH
jgi:hypothetical protein